LRIKAAARDVLTRKPLKLFARGATAAATIAASDRFLAAAIAQWKGRRPPMPAVSRQALPRLSLPPKPIGMHSAPFRMARAVLGKQHAETHAGFAVASLAQLMETNQLCLTRMLRLHGGAQPRGARQQTSDACCCQQQPGIHGVLLSQNHKA
jgi:hypothetical protein